MYVHTYYVHSLCGYIYIVIACTLLWLHILTYIYSCKVAYTYLLCVQCCKITYYITYITYLLYMYSCMVTYAYLLYMQLYGYINMFIICTVVRLHIHTLLYIQLYGYIYILIICTVVWLLIHTHYIIVVWLHIHIYYIYSCMYGYILICVQLCGYTYIYILGLQRYLDP